MFMEGAEKGGSVFSFFVVFFLLLLLLLASPPPVERRGEEREKEVEQNLNEVGKSWSEGETIGRENGSYGLTGT